MGGGARLSKLAVLASGLACESKPVFSVLLIVGVKLVFGMGL